MIERYRWWVGSIVRRDQSSKGEKDYPLRVTIMSSLKVVCVDNCGANVGTEGWLS